MTISHSYIVAQRDFLRTTWPAPPFGGPRLVIAVTGFGTGHSRDAIGMLQRVPFRLVFGRPYDDKDAQEMRIRKSDLE